MNPVKNRINETKINNQGLNMTIIGYRSCKDIDVKFDDGYISYNKQYTAFKNGQIFNFNIRRTDIKDRTGETKLNNNGNKMTIKNYTSIKNIIVEFEDGSCVNATYGNFKRGQIQSPNEKTVFNIGYIGLGKNKVSENGKHTSKYKYWFGLMQRCYNKDFHIKEPTYKNCMVSEQWYNFQNFCEWYDENYYQIEGERIALDKDILHKGNKIYSPENCVFVPERINTLFIKCDSARGNYPIGVSYNKRNNNFIANCSIYDYNKNKSVKQFLGYYSTPEDAFYLGYKPFKEKHIKRMADRYKEYIPVKLFNAMYDYEVNIDD
jgi:hypothetical protein